MPADRIYHLLTHVTLALAGLCLTWAEAPYLPELQPLLLLYLALLLLSWRLAGRRALPAWAANLFGAVIAVGAILGVKLHVTNGNDPWMLNVPLMAVIIPYLGPVLMALLLVRLFRPPAPGDFWLLQGLGLLQAALGCVLASDTLFGVFLLSYLVAAVCALALHERQAQIRLHSDRAGVLAEQPAPRREGRRWLLFGLRWTLAAGVLAGPLFVLMPRIEGPEWDPLARFGLPPNQTAGARMGFSDEIDLMRQGLLERDDSPVFTVRVTDPEGRTLRGLPANQRWRGVVLDRYDEGVWRSELSWTDRGAKRHPRMHLDEAPGVLWLTFHVPRQAGWLFLADPVRLGPEHGLLPVVPLMHRRQRAPLFSEASGTVVSATYLVEPEYRYVQSVPYGQDRNRYPAPRLPEPYLRKLIVPPPGQSLAPWALDLVRRLARRMDPANERLRAALERRHESGADLPPIVWEPVARMLTDHLAYSGEYTYSLMVRRDSLARDPVLDFLQSVKQGPCERYAAALALLLRSLGIPARIVKGFRGAEHQGNGVYLVRNSFAHAWVEALVVGKGKQSDQDWLILDPTPGAEAPAPASTLERWHLNGKALWRDLMLGYTAGGPASLWADLMSGPVLAGAAPWLGTGLFLLLLVWLVRRRRRASDAPGGPFALYARLLAVLARHGQMRPGRDETPAELAHRAGTFLASRPATAALADVPAQVVAVYYPMRFGGRAPGEEALRETTGRLDALAAAMRRG